MPESKSLVVGKNDAPVGIAPSIILENPRFAFNVGMAVRLCSCYGIPQLWFTGDRVQLDLDKSKRLPREERMKGYRDVQMINYDRPLEMFPEGTVPVAVEVRPNSERLQNFQHPENAVYVFGPEDSSIHRGLLTYCHRFVVIPTFNGYCLNLATAIATILWDRMTKLGTVPSEEMAFGQTGTYEDTKPGDIGLYNAKKDGTWPKGK
jgi:tRNA(Leu) C34 or U34 (ribose-2'-O)-methylase TrmL